MTNRNSTKNVWILSVISLVLCMSMLVGTTFAWFTDNATTGVNTIVAGNLDIALYKGTVTGAAVSYTDEVNEQTLLFSDTALWEPGYTEVAYLKVENKGTLALKALVNVNFTNEQEGINAAGEPFKLSDYLMYDLIDITENTFYATRTDALNAAKAGAKKIATETNEIKLVSKDVKYYALVVYMPETVGNEANYRNVKPSIQLGVNVFATQDTVERDSFDDQYDNGAQYDKADVWDGTEGVVPPAVDDTYVINTAAEFKAFATSVNGGDNYAGKTVKLNKSIDLENLPWTSIANFAGTFDGQGHTVSNMTTRLFGDVYGTIKNLKVKDVNVAYTAAKDRGTGFADRLSGTVENCEFTNITVSTTARGKNMAGLFGEISGKVTGCTANGLTVIAEGSSARMDSGAGGFAGIIKGGSEITDCIFNNVVVKADYANNVGGLFGKVGQEGQASITLKNITVNGLTMKVGDMEKTGATISNVGGFIGQCDYRTNDSRLTIDNCHINALDMTITSNGNGEDPTAGFISSLNGGADITNCSVDGKIDGANETLGVGGFLGTIGGHNAKNAYVVNITNCVADVAITGNDNIYVGGFVAYSGSRNKTITLTLNFTNCEAKDSFYGVLETGTNETSVFTGCKVDGADFNG